MGNGGPRPNLDQRPSRVDGRDHGCLDRVADGHPAAANRGRRGHDVQSWPRRGDARPGASGTYRGRRRHGHRGHAHTRNAHAGDGQPDSGRHRRPQRGRLRSERGLRRLHLRVGNRARAHRRRVGADCIGDWVGDDVADRQLDRPLNLRAVRRRRRRRRHAGQRQRRDPRQFAGVGRKRRAVAAHSRRRQQTPGEHGDGP